MIGLFAASGHASDLEVIWSDTAGSKVLKGWSLAEISQMKKQTSRERDPHSGQIAQWKGVLLSTVVDQALAILTPEQRSQIDLIILKNPDGGQSLIPRAFIVKYPVLLAGERQGQNLGAQGPFYSVVPWSSKPKINQENVPLESFFLPKIHTVELTNYREKYGSVFLKRRTDPAAIRGERIFVYGCISCHAAGQGPSVQVISRGLASSAHHPNAKGFANLSDRDWRALNSYITASKAEQPLPQASR